MTIRIEQDGDMWTWIIETIDGEFLAYGESENPLVACQDALYDADFV